MDILHTVSVKLFLFERFVASFQPLCGLKILRNGLSSYAVMICFCFILEEYCIFFYIKSCLMQEACVILYMYCAQNVVFDNQTTLYFSHFIDSFPSEMAPSIGFSHTFYVFFF